jgi:hypothetical protein
MRGLALIFPLDDLGMARIIFVLIVLIVKSKGVKMIKIGDKVRLTDTYKEEKPIMSIYRWILNREGTIVNMRRGEIRVEFTDKDKMATFWFNDMDFGLGKDLLEE